MDNREKYCYWEEYAQYDIDTAVAMFDAGRYLYAAFMCQQAIEKIVKGIFVLYTGEEPVKTHNIALVFNSLCDRDEFYNLVTDKNFNKCKERYMPLFVRLLAFYISARYPAYKEKLTSILAREEAQEIITEAKEAFKWVQSLKKYLM